MTRPENMTLAEEEQWNRNYKFYVNHGHNEEEASRRATEDLKLTRKQKFDNIKPEQSKPWGQRRPKP